MPRQAETRPISRTAISDCRIGVDIGGTFTDVVVTSDGTLHSCKVPTTPMAPEEGVFEGIARILAETGLEPGQFQLVMHGTTLATNALIERKGARTAMLVTEGFRDAVEIAYENRFEQYDIFMEKPPPLVPREHRFGVRERIDAEGNVLVPLDERSVLSAIDQLRKHDIESVAIGLIHAYATPEHELRLADLLSREMPDLWISLSSQVSPEIREYERWSTTAANAYVMPLMSRYLGRLSRELNARGFSCPLVLMTSGGGLMSLDAARRFPIRLVESGPAGGVVLATLLARQHGLSEVLSFDMGGTTAKICLVDNGEPQYARNFEVARQYRFLQGSGLPLRIPVIEMVEIGAGGGSIARVDSMSRIRVGPDSAGAVPGPVCYGRGGVAPTVTDADAVLGRVNPGSFASGAIRLDPDSAEHAIRLNIAEPLAMHVGTGALGIVEVVEENMANAARVHAVERGRNVQGRTMIAFGGAAPLHAVRVARKLNINTIVVPVSAGVGSAVGFLQAPVSYEVVRSRYARLDDAFDPEMLNGLYKDMRQEAEEIVRPAAPGVKLSEVRTADMRYSGQGHEVTVTLPEGPYSTDVWAELVDVFTAGYRATYGRHIPDLGVEVISWALRLEASAADPPAGESSPGSYRPDATSVRPIVLDQDLDGIDVPVYSREMLRPGAEIWGPAVIEEDETSTVILPEFRARIVPPGHIFIEREVA